METILQKAEAHVTTLLREKLPPGHIYHNIHHTRNVVNKAKVLIAGEAIGEEESEIIQLSAWFHDVGYIISGEGHEEHGVKIATTFLEEENAGQETILKIKNCILATQKTTEPVTLPEKILCDADTSHLAEKNYSDTGELLRQEWAQQNNMQFTDMQWVEENIQFFSTIHQYYTPYAQEKWQPEKDKNLVRLYKELRKLKAEQEKSVIKEKELTLKRKKAKTPERGIETMFRVTLRNHITLSNIADTKANILLSVNAIIISVALSNLIPKLDNPSNNYLIIPTVIFVAFSVISMGLSVLATRPNVTSGEFTKEDVKQKKVNLLFFGNFHKMKLDEFEWAMGEMMQDHDYLYSSLKKDLYFLGLVLHKKYKMLRFTYTVFLAGIILSVIAFAISFQTI